MAERNRLAPLTWEMVWLLATIPSRLPWHVTVSFGHVIHFQYRVLRKIFSMNYEVMISLKAFLLPQNYAMIILESL